MAQPDLDPRYEWIEVFEFGSPGPQYIRGPCKHLETVPVEGLDGQLLAHLCLTCDRQFTVV